MSSFWSRWQRARKYLGLAADETVCAVLLCMLGGATLGAWHLGLGIGAVVIFDLVRAGRAYARPSGGQALRIGPSVLLWVVAALLMLAVGPFVFWLHQTLPREVSDPLVVYVFAGTTTLGVAAGSLVLARADDVARGTPGAVRMKIGGYGTRVFAYAQLLFGYVVYLASHDRVSFELDLMLDDSGGGSPIASYLQTIDAVAIAQGVERVLGAAYGMGAVSALFMVVAILSSWFLLPLVVRRVVFYFVDTLVTAGFVFVLYALPFVPSEEHPDAVELPAIALSVTTLFAIRATALAMPRLLDLIEMTGFRSLVAARMLRAKKSGFLTVIGVLSIMAVSFSSCTLATTLSVMGGFRADLQQKILGNHAHVVVDREYGTWDAWQPSLETARGVDGVLGVTPYVAGEVMITSASSLAGAELRGIDPTTIGDVTDLPRNMRHGRLDYLSHPDELLHLSADEMSGSLLLPELLGADAGDDEAPFGAPPDDDAPSGLPPVPGETSTHGSITREIDDLLHTIDERQGTPNQLRRDDTATDPSATRREQIADELDEFLIPETLDRPSMHDHARDLPPADVLPGLVVGQELARTLRLHVGDEVNVVSPNGDLGPTGPVPRTRPFRVAGIFYSGMYEYDMQMAYTDLATAQRFLGTGTSISGLEIRVEDWERAEMEADRVRGALRRDELRVRSWQEVNRNLFGALALEKLAMFITLGIAILVASFCVVGTLTLMVQEKGREVAILKAMGAEDRTMVGMFLLQGLFIGLVGALSGLGLGYVVCFAAEHLGIHMNPEVYYIDRLPVHVDGAEFAWVGVAAVLVCVLATIYPAILGSRLKPVDALRDR